MIIRYSSPANPETFKIWNECALEKLRFIRDEPNGKVPGYENATGVFAKDGGLELDGAYYAYIQKRKSLQSAAPLDVTTFPKIIEENTKLMSPDISVASAATSAQELATIKSQVEAFSTAIKAIQTASNSGGKK